VVESLTHHPGNATQLWRYVRADKAPGRHQQGSVVDFLLHYLGRPVPGPFPDRVLAAVTLLVTVVLVVLTRVRLRGLGTAEARRRPWGTTEGLLATFAATGVPLEIVCLLLLLPKNLTFPPSQYWLTPLTVVGTMLWATTAWMATLVVGPRLATSLPTTPVRIAATAAAWVAAVVVCVTSTTYAMAENHVLSRAGAIAVQGVQRDLPPGTPVRVASGGATAYDNPVAGITYRLMRAGVFACGLLPWPLPESTDYRQWSACPTSSPVVVAVLDDSEANRPNLPGAWRRLGTTSAYTASNGTPRSFTVYLVTPPLA